MWAIQINRCPLGSGRALSWSQPNRGHDTRNCLKRKILAPGIQICLVLFARHVEILQKKRRHHIRTKSAQEPSLSFYRLSLKSILALTQPVSSPRFETRLRARGTPPKKNRNDPHRVKKVARWSTGGILKMGVLCSLTTCFWHFLTSQKNSHKLQTETNIFWIEEF